MAHISVVPTVTGTVKPRQAFPVVVALSCTDASNTTLTGLRLSIYPSGSVSSPAAVAVGTFGVLPGTQPSLTSSAPLSLTTQGVILDSFQTGTHVYAVTVTAGDTTGEVTSATVYTTCSNTTVS